MKFLNFFSQNELSLNKSDLAPIVLFVYNRPNHTLQTLEALTENELAKDSVLYVYADGPKEGASEEQKEKIRRTREVIASKKWCKEMHLVLGEKNKGLADSIIAGVTEVVNKHGKIIVLEDDLVTSKGFLAYMNKALALYEKEEKVMQVSGHFFPVKYIKPKNSAFFLPMTTSWGWATWKRAWDKFDPEANGYEILSLDPEACYYFNLEGSFPYYSMLIDQMERKTINSWAIRWWWSVFKNKGISLFPDKALVENIGFGSEGTHTTDERLQGKGLDLEYAIKKFPSKIKVSWIAFEPLKRYLREVSFSFVTQEQNLFGRFIFKIKAFFYE